MKYMTFNNSCFFAAIANLLEDIGIHVSDKDIVIGSLVPYFFKYDKNSQQFSSGYEVQELDIINDYLKQYIVKIIEKKYFKGSVIEKKRKLIQNISETTSHKIVSLKLTNNDNKWHATIFTGVVNEEYIFVNMRREDDEAIEIRLKYDELINKLADNVQFAWLERIEKFDVLDRKKYLDESIVTLLKYKNMIFDYSEEEKSLSSRLESRDALFRPLLLNYVDMASITHEKELYENIMILQRQYLNSFQVDGKVKLSSYLDMLLLKKCIFQIENNIKAQLSTLYYHGSKTSGITKLYPNMSIHGDKYVYLTTKREVALIYTINAIESFYETNSLEKPEKFHPWYSYGFNKGKLQIDEYYENAFEETYKGKSGYLYVCKEPDKNITNQTNIFCAVTTKEIVDIIEEVYIEDIYSELIRLESAGIILIRRFTDMTEKQIDHLNISIKGSIKHFDLHNKPDNNYTIFLRSKFPDLFN